MTVCLDMVRRIVWGLFLLVLVGCAGSGGGGAVEEATGTLKAGAKYLDTAVATVAAMDAGSITFSALSETLAVGDVVVVPFGEGGVLRRVTGVLGSGPVVVTTEDAALVDFFETLTLEQNYAVDPGAMTMTSTPPAGVTVELEPARGREPGDIVMTFDNASYTALGGVIGRVNGEVRAKLSIDFRTYVDDNGIISAFFIPTFTTTQNLDVTVDTIEASLEIGTFELPSIRTLVITPAGPVPVWFSGEVAIETKLNAQTGGLVTCGVTGSQTVSAGLIYSRGGGLSRSQSSTAFSGSFRPPELLPQDQLTINYSPVRATVSYRLYGTVGPFVTLDAPQIPLTITEIGLPEAGLDVTIDSQFVLSGGIRFQVLDTQIADLNAPSLTFLKANWLDQFFPFEGSTGVTIR